VDHDITDHQSALLSSWLQYHAAVEPVRLYSHARLGAGTNHSHTRTGGRGRRASAADRVETQLDQTTHKTELALKNLENLRLERNFVLGAREGAHFTPHSAALTAAAQHAIAAFLNTLGDTEGAIFLVAGHTDSQGSAHYNHTLGQKRAASVARYLVTQQGIDPLRVTTVSYGEHNPLADNRTPEGRLKNRRVEILVYTETVTSAPGKHRLELERTGRR
jgi:outer membrane protein OmpA-like peptidoglycan-associated protein